MAIAVNGGHVSRAIDLYKAPGKYFIVGCAKTAWEDETTPDIPNITDFRLKDVVGLKKVDNAYLVVPDENGSISYRSQNWRIVVERVETTIGNTGVTEGSKVVTVVSIAGLTIGSKVRVANTYEGTIVSISGLSLTLDTAAPEYIKPHSVVLGGAEVEGAKYVYVEGYLNYDEFPLVTYRQIGLCTNVTPNTVDVLRSADYTPNNTDEFTSLGILEILDNRVPTTRDINQRELLSMIVEL